MHSLYLSNYCLSINKMDRFLKRLALGDSPSHAKKPKSPAKQGIISAAFRAQEFKPYFPDSSGKMFCHATQRIKSPNKLNVRASKCYRYSAFLTHYFEKLPHVYRTFYFLKDMRHRIKLKNTALKYRLWNVRVVSCQLKTQFKPHFMFSRHNIIPMN